MICSKMEYILSTSGLDKMPKLLIGIGILLVILGLLYHFFGNIFSWFGHLPGDISVEKENFRLYVPLTSMILVSVVLNILFRIWTKFFM